MSQENVEVVRTYYSLLDRWLQDYWRNPGPLEEAAGVDRVLEQLDPDAEWDWRFSSRTFHGRDEIMEGATDLIDAVDDWRIRVEELVDGTSGRVLVVYQGTGERRADRAAHVLCSHGPRRKDRADRGLRRPRIRSQGHRTLSSAGRTDLAPTPRVRATRDAQRTAS